LVEHGRLRRFANSLCLTVRSRFDCSIDLTSYHPQLVKGVEGITIGAYGVWSKGSDRFVGVRFQGIGTFDVLWESLEIVEFIADCKARERQQLEALKSARNVVRYTGPRGGFKCLSYEYVDKDGVLCHVSTAGREECDKLTAFFHEQGIAIRLEVLN